ncbi:hypothetical protein BJ878DRAFT_478118 [Calycina marina]|uniref:Uncharacterized protein n=1 Tax=Calycina marina TaxID=1763456 RepID=A0A9P7Z7D7_9HELO|nr:hypothetical protein BJ878DRAFT_478118 [Calycina marina]
MYLTTYAIPCVLAFTSFTNAIPIAGSSLHATHITPEFPENSSEAASGEETAHSPDHKANQMPHMRRPSGPNERRKASNLPRAPLTTFMDKVIECQNLKAWRLLLHHHTKARITALPDQAEDGRFRSARGLWRVNGDGAWPAVNWISR